MVDRNSSTPTPDSLTGLVVDINNPILCTRADAEMLIAMAESPRPPNAALSAAFERFKLREGS